jgi:signal transduction histidine kinase
MLTAESAATLLDRDGGDTAAARVQLTRLTELAREALDELRALILELRPAELERDGLEGAVRMEVEMLGRLHDVEIDLELSGETMTGSPDVLRIVQEALHNALRHARPGRVTVRLAQTGGRMLVEVTDDGIGFDPEQPELRSRHLGLTSMEERARELGGHLEIRSAPGAGTTVRLDVANLGADA